MWSWEISTKSPESHGEWPHEEASPTTTTWYGRSSSYADLSALKDLVGTFAYICSKKGKRWAGFEIETAEIKEATQACGWEEAHLPSWHVVYRFEKDLD